MSDIYYWHWFLGWQFTFWESILHIDQKHYREAPLHKKYKKLILLGGEINNQHFITNPLLIEDICKWHITFILLHYWVVWGYSAGFVPTFFLQSLYLLYVRFDISSTMFINLWQQIRSSYLGNVAVTVPNPFFFSCDTIVIEVSIFIFIVRRLACHEVESWSVLKKHTHLEPPSKCLVTSWTWHVSLQYISNLKLLMHNKWVVMYICFL